MIPPVLREVVSPASVPWAGCLFVPFSHSTAPVWIARPTLDIPNAIRIASTVLETSAVPTSTTRSITGSSRASLACTGGPTEVGNGVTFTRQSRPVWRTPHLQATCSRTDSIVSGGVPGRGRGGAIAVGLAGRRDGRHRLGLHGGMLATLKHGFRVAGCQKWIGRPCSRSRCSRRRKQPPCRDLHSTGTSPAGPRPIPFFTGELRHPDSVDDSPAQGRDNVPQNPLVVRRWVGLSRKFQVWEKGQVLFPAFKRRFGASRAPWRPS